MPIEVTCDACQARYTLKDELGGKRVRCKQCANILEVPLPALLTWDEPTEAIYDTAPPGARDPGAARGARYHPAFARDKFFVNQKRLAVNEKYYVYDEAKNPILFIERPMHWGRQIVGALGTVAVLFAGIAAAIGLAYAVSGGFAQGREGFGIAALVVGILATLVATVAVAIRLTPLRHITVYTDPERTERLLEIRQDKKVHLIRGTYSVLLPDGTRLGSVLKNYLYNFFRKRWYVSDAAGNPLLLVQEDSLILSLLRRFLGPFFGILRTNFIIQPAGSDEVIGMFNRKFTLFDRYVLDLSADRFHRVDRRLGVALAVLLDTGESR